VKEKKKKKDKEERRSSWRLVEQKRKRKKEKRKRKKESGAAAAGKEKKKRKEKGSAAQQHNNGRSRGADLDFESFLSTSLSSNYNIYIVIQILYTNVKARSQIRVHGFPKTSPPTVLKKRPKFCPIPFSLSHYKL
jgi:hypothetical protein